MTRRFLHWMGRNVGALLLAFILAVIVWVSAVTSADPNQQQIYLIPVEIIGLASNHEITSPIPERLSLTLFAPRSILDQITKETGSLQAWFDLTALPPGSHTVPLQYQIAAEYRPVRVTEIDPPTIDVTLEELISQIVPIQTDVQGDPDLGYQASVPNWSHDQVVVSGRASQVGRVATVKAVLDISGADETIERAIKLVAEDEEGSLVTGVTLTPNEINVIQTITLRGGYRNMVVKVVTAGQVADGYRQTSISVSPPNVMVFSADPALVDQLPGYVETAPIELTGAVDDIETSLALDLSEGVSVIGDSNVLVQVGIAAMDGNLKIIRVVETIGMLPEYQARVSPETVDVILFGPLPVLDALTETDVRVVLDLTGLEKGIHQLTPQVIILPERIQADAITPGTLEVEISAIGEGTLTPQP